MKSDRKRKTYITAEYICHSNKTITHEKSIILNIFLRLLFVSFFLLRFLFLRWSNPLHLNLKQHCLQRCIAAGSLGIVKPRYSSFIHPTDQYFMIVKRKKPQKPMTRNTRWQFGAKFKIHFIASSTWHCNFKFIVEEKRQFLLQFWFHCFQFFWISNWTFGYRAL